MSNLTQNQQQVNERGAYFLPGHVIPRRAFGESESPKYFCKPCGEWVHLIKQNGWLCCPVCGDQKLTDGQR